MYALEKVPVSPMHLLDSNQLVSNLVNVTVMIHTRETIVKNKLIAVSMDVSMEDVLHTVLWSQVWASVSVKDYSGVKIVANLSHALNHVKTVEAALVVQTVMLMECVHVLMDSMAHNVNLLSSVEV